MEYARRVNGRVRMMGYEEAWKYALRKDPTLRVVNGYRVRVPAGTKTVYIPRKYHYARTVKTEESELTETLEPCVVKRGVNGFGLHECEHHREGGPSGPVFIEEQVRAT